MPSSSQTVASRPDAFAASIFPSMWSMALVPSGTAATAVTAPSTTESMSRAARRLPSPAGRADACAWAAARNGSLATGFHGVTGPSGSARSPAAG